MSRSDGANSTNSVADERIKGAHYLDGDVGELTAYYDQWAANYDKDSEAEWYQGPTVLADLAALCHSAYLSGKRGNLEILDAGCGTGQVGTQLQRRGFHTIDGADLSPGMVRQATLTGAYRELFDQVDLSTPAHGLSGNYDLVVSCGLFLHGHLKPSGLGSLLGMVRPGGILLTNTRTSYLNATDFADAVEDLQRDSIAEVLVKLDRAHYLNEEAATYWALRALDPTVRI